MQRLARALCVGRKRGACRVEGVGGELQEKEVNVAGLAELEPPEEGGERGPEDVLEQ